MKAKWNITPETEALITADKAPTPPKVLHSATRKMTPFGVSFPFTFFEEREGQFIIYKEGGKKYPYEVMYIPKSLITIYKLESGNGEYKATVPKWFFDKIKRYPIGEEAFEERRQSK
ncbi:MAG: hypothetical protein DRP42_03235 [Tenericutes bacterium]|nr:MAG: hypothetical protein DRP42_03235 [Mycoplasmatota bacterium]